MLCNKRAEFNYSHLRKWIGCPHILPAMWWGYFTHFMVISARSLFFVPFFWPVIPIIKLLLMRADVCSFRSNALRLKQANRVSIITAPADIQITSAPSASLGSIPGDLETVQNAEFITLIGRPLSTTLNVLISLLGNVTSYLISAKAELLINRAKTIRIVFMSFLRDVSIRALVSANRIHGPSGSAAIQAIKVHLSSRWQRGAPRAFGLA